MPVICPLCSSQMVPEEVNGIEGYVCVFDHCPIGHANVERKRGEHATG